MENRSGTSAPAISVPKGGGAIKGIGETFRADAFTGAAYFSVPIAISPGREGFNPELKLDYSSGHGNGPFGLGWQLSVPRITRKTEKGLPTYTDEDVFVLSGVEDLVPVLDPVTGSAIVQKRSAYADPGSPEIKQYDVTRYRPRVEGLFARIEKWVRNDDGDVHWRIISKDNVTNLYGRTPAARLVDPDPLKSHHIFEWLLQETFDAKGNHALYEYVRDSDDLHLTQIYEDNRQYGQLYLRRILYGNTPDTLSLARRAGPHRIGTHHRDPTTTVKRNYVFEVLFDYYDLGDHPSIPYDWTLTSELHARKDWPIREDAFSSFRSGFEIRTLRRCRRVLMLHHFTEGGMEGAPLVRSTDFEYETDKDTRLSLLKAVTVRGYRKQNDDTYRSAEMPSVTFSYSEFKPNEQRYRSVSAKDGDSPPRALNDPNFVLIDVYGDGLPDVMETSRTGYYYWRNLGNAVLERRHPQHQFPSGITLSEPNVALGDMGGDGLPDLIVQDRSMSGFFEATPDGGWKPFKRFATTPTFDLGDPNVRLLDLTGDGLSDVLVTGQHHFSWYKCLGEKGYGEPRFVERKHDLNEFPDVSFANSAGRVRLADMSGDGLNDIVVVHSGRIDYWPNLGHGRFGKRITMAGAPRFDYGFDPRKLFLVDLAGSGCADVVYVDFNRVHFWFNRSGNAWSERQTIDGTPYTVDHTAVQFADFFGTGTTCLVWSYDFNFQPGGNYKVLDFCGNQKPYLLIGAKNNLGAETHIHYAPSTKFYLADRAAGEPWITSLPFPVHTVEQLETYDHLSRTRFVSRYAYHHGYFDGEEREFRGFGMVEQWDTEEIAVLTGDGTLPQATNIDAASHVPPVHTKSWFHTGPYIDREHISRQFEREYYREPGLNDQEFQALLLPDTTLPTGLIVEEEREACRALGGRMLRQEVYADDAVPGSSEVVIHRAKTPYTVVEQNFTIRVLQPRAGNRHAVFFTHPREAITYHYERNPADPRIQHALMLEVDAYGNVLKQATIGYGRRSQVRVVDAQGNVQLVPNPGLAELHAADQAKQTTALLTYIENRVTNAIELSDTHRNPLPCEALTFELTGYTPTGPARRYQDSDLVEPDLNAAGRLRHKFTTPEVAYEATAAGNQRRRPIEWLRTLYRRDDLSGLLPLGDLQPLALPGESYKLAFTPGLLAQVFQRPRHAQLTEPLLPDPAAVLGGQAGNRGGYLQSQTLKADGRFPASDVDDHWWIPSGQSFFSTNRADPAANELAQARQHFFLPRRYRDPFGQDAFADFDANDLLMVETRDALGNRVTVDANDYRVLQPRLVSDPNRNQTEVAFDTLGMVVGTAVMGKPLPAPVEGDSLTGFVTDLTQVQIDGFFGAPDPHADAPALLRDATTRIVYDLHRFRRTQEAHPDDPTNWQPPCAATLARETHASAPLPSQGLKIQLSFSYSDGFGREIQKKIQAEPGTVVEGGPTINPRWVGSGWTIFNNKGKPVRQYEPFFTATQSFEFGAQDGVSSVLFYDPAERVIATLHPNHTFEKVMFDPWQQTTYDVNDTCAQRNTQTGDPRTDPDIQRYVVAYFKTQPANWQTWHAQRIGGALGPHEQAAARAAAAHADTPTTAHFDALGRSFLTVARNRVVCAGHELDGTEDSFATRVELDIEGNQRAVRDAIQQASDPLGRVVMRYTYDMLGNRIYQLSMEGGARWMLNDVAGKPIRAWDGRGHNFISTYDALRRLIEQYVRGTRTDSDPRTLNRDILVDKIEYGEGLAIAEALNLRTRIYQHFDSAGVATNARLNANGEPIEAYDFKDNLLHSTRRLVSDYTAIPDWLLNPSLDDETFEGSTRYDALNRPIQSIAPHSSLARTKRNVVQPVFNEAHLLERVDVWLERAAEPADLLDPNNEAPSPVGVANIDYNAKGQRQRIDYKNGASTFYLYDPLTFRLVHLYTRRGAAFIEDCDNPQPPPPPTIAAPETPPQGKACGLQNLHYTYDPAGNITRIQDDAQQTIYFRNQRVEPSNDYIYDALYRLIQASGREHLGQLANGERNPPTAPDAFNAFHTRQDHPNVLKAMGTYIERYVYDAVDNFLQMQHRGSDPAHAGWRRAYDYAETSLIEDGSGGVLLKTSNRLTRTTLNPNGANPVPEPYQHDAHGNVVRMPHLGGGLPGPNMHWDSKDQLRQSDLGGGGAAFYVYDASGQRVRKVWEKAPGLIEEHIYLGGFEIYRRHADPVGVNTATLERETLHVMDDKQRIALVEMRTLDTAGNDSAPQQLIRYQFGNHLSSASLELDNQAQIISYEEYAPYGSSTYQAVRSRTETAKRYRYTGKERDEENGLYYHGARHYAPWLARWASADPAGLRDGNNLYVYVSGSPVRKIDPKGTQGTPVSEVAEEAIEQLDQLDQPFQQQGKVGLREQALSMDIDEPNPVGQKGISPTEARARAIDPNNRQLLDPLTNRQTKHLGVDPRAVPSKPQAPVSVAQNPNALLTRRFSEITEMQEIFDEALSKIKDPGKLSPTELKNRINSYVWDIIKSGKSESAAKVRAALENLGFENIQGRGYVMKAVEVPAQAEAAAKVKAGGRPFQFVKWGGRVLLVVGIGLDAIEVYYAENKAKTITKKVGFWAGAWAGGKAGAWGGARVGGGIALALGQMGPQVAAPEELVTVPAGGLIGGILGGVGGAVIGGWTAGEITETIYEWTFEKR